MGTTGVRRVASHRSAGAAQLGASSLATLQRRSTLGRRWRPRDESSISRMRGNPARVYAAYYLALAGEREEAIAVFEEEGSALAGNAYGSVSLFLSRALQGDAEGAASTHVTPAAGAGRVLDGVSRAVPRGWLRTHRTHRRLTALAPNCGWMRASSTTRISRRAIRSWPMFAPIHDSRN